MTKSPDIQTLREAINLMDCYSQDGFGEIEAIAKLALVYMEAPDSSRHQGNIALALRAIAGKAADIMNCINCEAEQIGCNYIDKAWARRNRVELLAATGREVAP